MDNGKYLSKLDKYLRKLPPEDRADAIAYYAEYLAEAGPDGANMALRTLGSPAQVAAGIMAEYSMKSLIEGEPKVKKGISAVWFAVIGVFALPVGLPLAIAGMCIIFALFVVIFAVLFSLYVSAVAMVGSGLFTVICGLVIMPQSFATSLFYIGCGLVAMGFGILLFIGVTALTRVSLKGIARLFNAIRFRKLNKQMRRNTQAQTPPPEAQPVNNGPVPPEAQPVNSGFVPSEPQPAESDPELPVTQPVNTGFVPSEPQPAENDPELPVTQPAESSSARPGPQFWDTGIVQPEMQLIETENAKGGEDNE